MERWPSGLRRSLAKRLPDKNRDVGSNPTLSGLKIIFFSFFLYSCIAPVNYDKANIKRRWNYYGGINIFYQKGVGSIPSIFGSSNMKYGALGKQINGGTYYGFNKNFALGVEFSSGFAVFRYRDFIQE